jgi:hypothetical protein
MGYARQIFALGRAGYLPSVFAQLHPRFKTPHVATLAGGVVGIATIYSDAFVQIAGQSLTASVVTLSAFGALTMYIVSMAALFRLRRSEPGLAAWRRAMTAIARQPNVHLKVSEFGLRDQPWDEASNRRIVLEAIAIFGIERCMFASNFPVAGLRIDYDTLVRAVRRMLDDFSEVDRHRFFVANAAAFYRLELKVDAARSSSGQT